jgi:hypothetical protein
MFERSFLHLSKKTLITSTATKKKTVEPESAIESTPDHLLMDSASNLGPLIPRWEITSSKIADTEVSGF